MYKDIISGIYCIENIITNKKYIGQSINIKDRWSKHKSELNHQTHDNDYLQKAWNKYGENNFKFYIIERCNIKDLDEKEIYYIEYYNTLNRNYGYNLKSGGQCNGSQVTDYVKEKLSKALKKTYANNEEIREMRRKAALAQWSNPEIKAKILKENNGMYGKHHTAEAKKKISEKRMGKPSPHRNTTPVLCVELNKTFQDAVTACEKLGLKKTSTGSILQVCRHERKTCGGSHWEFIGK